jgi:hypothetical protein
MEKNMYTVNMIGNGFLQNQSLFNNLEQAKRKLFQYFVEHNEEFFEDGYVVISKFSDFVKEREVILNISMDEEIDEVRKYLNLNN